LIGVLFAVLAAAANAVSSVLQRKGAMSAPPEHASGWRVVVDQLHHKVWFEGFGLLIIGFLLQATALAESSLALVQPILACELPFTLLVAVRIIGGRLGRREWLAVAAMAGGLGALLASAAPTTGHADTSGAGWAWGCGCALLLLGAVAAAGWRFRGASSAALLGVAAGGMFGLTATFMANVTERAQQGLVPLFGSWQLYAMIAGGFAAIAVLQQAYGAGTLAASQPGVTMADPVVAAALGIALFDERIRLGWLIPVELIGIAAIAIGAIELSRSPLVSGGQQPPGEPADEGSVGAKDDAIT
jgi:drug/metabolite transporter (DMT)-like permease